MTRDDDARVAADARHTTPGDESGRESVIPIELRDLKQNEDVKDAEAEENKASSGLPRVFSYGSPRIYLLQAIAAFAAVASGVALAMVNLVIGNFMSLLSDFSFSDGPGMSSNFMSAVSTTSLYFVAIGIVRLVASYVYSSLFTYSAFHLTRNLRQHYLKSALRQEIAYYDEGLSGSISQQATSNGKLIQSGISEKLGIVIQAISTFVAAFIIAFVSQWRLTLILIWMLPTLLFVLGFIGGLDAKLETSILAIYAQAGTYAENILGGVRTVHAFSLRPRVMAKYGTYLDEAFDIGMKKNILYGGMFGFEYFVVFGGTALAFWQGIHMLDQGEIQNLGTVFTVLFSVIIAATTVTQVAPHMITFTRAATAASQLFELIDRKSEIDPFDDSGDRPENTEGVLDLQRVKFSYPTRPDVTVLHDFTLNIPSGKVTALVGPSGSGKSTIIGLLERWYNPTTGALLLDGQDISKLNLQWLRTNVRLVQQEPVLFNATVFENIANGLVGTAWENDSDSDKLLRVKDAAKLAFAHDFIESLPQGYETRIGERGGLLSGGQKQRVAIARSIISQPKILLLDEATSALDPHAEEVVQKALDSVSKGRTTVVIAHKLATIRHADNIVVMSNGRIVEQGRHEDLVAKQGTYAGLVRAQDLAPSSDDASSDMEDSSEELKNHLSLAQSHTRGHTRDGEQAATLADREDHDLYDKSGLIYNIWKLLRSTPEIWGWFSFAFTLSIAGAAAQPGQAVLLGKVMSVFDSPNMVERGNFISLMFFVLALGIFVVYFNLGWSANVVAQTLGRKMRQEILQSFLRQDLQFFDRPENTVGALISRLDSYPHAILELMGFNITIILMSVISVFASSILSIVVSWKVGLVGTFAGLPPILLGGWSRLRIETKMDETVGQSLSTSASVASETVTAIRTVSSLALEEAVLRKYVDELDRSIAQTKGPMFHMMVYYSLTQSVEYFVLALGFWWGSKLISEGQITFYQFLVSFMGVYFSGQNAALAFSFCSSFTKSTQAANYFFWITELQATIRETEENRKKGPEDDCSSFDFEKVQFSYPLAPQHRILNGISLSINKGEFVAFVGASGCGKSTMISLLERFYDPSSGSIVIDSASNLSDINPLLYRKQVALVQQEPTLFPGTIRENISQGLPDIHSTETTPNEVLEEACRAANAWDFVSSLPEGLDTPCGTSGSQLSGGQRQRIAIARALVRKPNVILLDEATSALDTESEKLVQGALSEAARNGNRITIAVAHRLSTVRDANRIFVFHGGRIVEAGPHGELLAKGGMYAKMCEAQRLDSTI